MNEDILKTLLFVSDIIETCPKEHLQTFLLDIATIKDMESNKEITSLTIDEAEYIQKEFRKNVLQQIANRDILKPTYEYGFKKENFDNLPLRKVIKDEKLNDCYCKIEQI